MKTYIVTVDRYGTGDGKLYANGATLFADELTPGRIAAGLRMGHLQAGPEREKPKPKPPADPATPPAAVGSTEPLDEPLDEPAGYADERLDAAIDTLPGVEPAAIEALKASEFLCIGDLVEHLKEHGTLQGCAQGIGKGRAQQLVEALAPYLPAGDSAAAENTPSAAA